MYQHAQVIMVTLICIVKPCSVGGFSPACGSSPACGYSPACTPSAPYAHPVPVDGPSEEDDRDNAVQEAVHGCTRRGFELAPVRAPHGKVPGHRRVKLKHSKFLVKRIKFMHNVTFMTIGILISSGSTYVHP